jgi:hypothetical protein
MAANPERAASAVRASNTLFAGALDAASFGLTESIWPLVGGTIDQQSWSYSIGEGLGYLSLGAPRVINGGFELGTRAILGIRAHTYPNAGGFGVNVLARPWGRVFGVDYHSVKSIKGSDNFLHYHRGLTRDSQKMHRPYEGGW